MVAYVQSDNTFRVVFDTTGLLPGTIKSRSREVDRRLHYHKAGNDCQPLR